MTNNKKKCRPTAIFTAVATSASRRNPLFSLNKRTQTLPFCGPASTNLTHQKPGGTSSLSYYKGMRFSIAEGTNISAKKRQIIETNQNRMNRIAQEAYEQIAVPEQGLVYEPAESFLA